MDYPKFAAQDITVNTAKRRLLEGKPALGGAVSLASPLAAEAIARGGFHFMLLDDQHGLWQPYDIMAAFRTSMMAGCIPMARVQKNDFGLIGAMLDKGALGIVVPMVNTRAQAEAAAYAMRYPPFGGRSEGAYGCMFHGPQYSTWADREMLLMVQIESVQAVENAEEILSVPGVDGCWIGPWDLMRTMGRSWSKPEDMKVHQAAMMHVLDTCKKLGKIPGTAIDNIVTRLTEGFQFVTPGSDYGYVIEGCQRTMQTVKAAGFDS
jgi:4-hydroxy-2-oxoheptanedioate aldolase